jgi:hypothetical protein
MRSNQSLTVFVAITVNLTACTKSCGTPRAIACAEERAALSKYGFVSREVLETGPKVLVASIAFPDGCKQECTTTVERSAADFDTILALSSAADQLFLGNVVKGGTAAIDGTLNPVLLERRGGTVTLQNLASLKRKEWWKFYERAPLAKHVAQTDLATIDGALRDLLRENPEARTGALVDYKRIMSNSVAASALELGLSAHWMTGGLQAEFSKTGRTKKNSFSVLLKQVYFTATFTPDGGYSFQSCSDASDARISNLVQFGDPPAYVSEVSFGRLLIMSIETDETEDAVNAGLQLALDFGAFGGAGKVSGAESRSLNDSIAHYFFLGGTAPNALTLATASALDAVNVFLSKEAGFSTDNVPVPIAYSLRHVADGSRLVTTTSMEHASNKVCAVECKAECDKPVTVGHVTNGGKFRSITCSACVQPRSNKGIIPVVLKAANKSEKARCNFKMLVNGGVRTETGQFGPGDAETRTEIAPAGDLLRVEGWTEGVGLFGIDGDATINAGTIPADAVSVSCKAVCAAD